MTHEEFVAYLKGNAIKYLWRLGHKGFDDHKKAAWYVNRLASEIEDSRPVEVKP